MEMAKRHWARWSLAAGILGILAGCSPTPIYFQAAPGTVLFVNDKPHHLPASVEFSRYAGNGQANRYDVRLVFSTPAGDVRARGTIEIYGYTESDLDPYVTNQCEFTGEQLASLAEGKTLVYKGVTVSKQPLFELTLKRE
jgi:hypothetical protein